MAVQTPSWHSGPRATTTARVVASAPLPNSPGLPSGATSLFVLGVAIGIVDAVLVPYFGGTADPALKHSWTRVGVFVLALAALFVLLVSIGVGVTGKRSGVLWSNRNTYSLSRLQVVLWSWLVLAALLAVVICRAWGWVATGASSGLSVALNIYIPPELLQVMGISVASGAAAPAILSLKSQSSAPSKTALDVAANRVGVDVHSVGGVFVRSDQFAPLIVDLFQSDDAAAAGTVDMSKVQQFAVTLTLWGVYLAMLLQLFFSGSTGGVLPLLDPPGSTALPALSQTFVYLLGISHAGYLAYKAVPITPATSGAAPGSAVTVVPTEAIQGAQSRSALPSTVLPRPQPPKVT